MTFWDFANNHPEAAVSAICIPVAIASVCALFIALIVSDK